MGPLSESQARPGRVRLSRPDAALLLRDALGQRVAIGIWRD